ncbi:hypothetical protein DB30_02554 [Enhygromyxa salina]|uniref:Copper type II ascorbate-dependent monooxygenase C-terminal domain-containing protein n=1 Tax=Enhygromyxa salina TaxID=215803 RepID=A0A0C1Z2R7_9BACT|nr:hypothetical protein DB30_02554 [Enhygromyxa salina]
MGVRVALVVGSLGVLGVLGCGDPSSDADTQADDSSDTDALRPSWHQDIAPLIHAHCVRCHQPGGVAPMSLHDHDSAAPWAAQMLDEVVAGTMPPWGPRITERCQPDHDFVDDPTLANADVDLLARWLAAGAPVGDPATAAPLPKLDSLALTDVSASFHNAAPYSFEGPGDAYVCFSADLGLTEPRFLDGIEVLPDNEAIVHHVLVWVTPTPPAEHPGPWDCPPGAILEGAWLLGIWVPGASPTVFPEGVSFAVPAGAHVILSYHYHPPGPGTHTDRSGVALRWQAEPTPWLGAFALLGLHPEPDQLLDPPFMIPAGASDHPETVAEPWPVDEVSLFSIGTHMHYVGRDQLISVQRPGQSLADADCLLHTPAWDFDWQRLYQIDRPLEQLPTLGPGDTVWMDCRYDNTLDNPGVARALSEQGLSDAQDVYWGDSSLDEMCVGLVGVAWPLAGPDPDPDPDPGPDPGVPGR